MLDRSMSASRGGDGQGKAWMAMAREGDAMRAINVLSAAMLAVQPYTYGSSSARPGPVLVPVHRTSIAHYQYQPQHQWPPRYTLPSSHLPRLLAVHCSPCALLLTYSARD
jgi:hypothetical protein